MMLVISKDFFITNGSGDGFVPIDLDDLKLLSDELNAQENSN